MSPFLQVVIGFFTICAFLAFVFGVVLPVGNEKQKRQIEKAKRKVDEIKNEGEKSKQNTKIELERMISDKDAEAKALLEKAKGMMHRIASDTEQQHPWLAKEIADTEYLIDKQLAQELRTKKNPAVKAADEITKISKEKRLLKEQNRLMEYQLDLYERNFPWLLDFKKLAPKEAEDYSNEENTMGDEKEYLSKWLSDYEYNQLSNAEKYQLALDRYLASPRTTWEAGIAYERYIGYLYEKEGYSVIYEGATKGVQDRGIDIIAQNKKETVIIQCKRYSMTKNHLVHENTVAQLFGVSTVYRMEKPTAVFRAVIYTSSTLSEEAKHFAEYLGIEVFDSFPLKEYPVVKCNTSKNGEKIYHLPFDQQYDKVRIKGKKGDKYVRTVSEAEGGGYRRAYRWRGSNDSD